MNVRLTTMVLAYALATIFVLSQGLPVLDESGFDNATIEELKNSVNDTKKNLYVVKAVVYEIGILTEADENDTSFESQERVDLTFYDAHTNKSHIDLGNIPLPIQTNVSGQVLTGIAPVNIGAFSSPAELLETLPLTGTIVNITHSNTAFYQLTKSNKSSGEKPHVVGNDELVNLPNIANLLEAVSTRQPPPLSTKSVLSNSLESIDD
ncbi:uncharacterized protein LOC119683270 [Teleopsis dalmanni]|uniref:uncharacterized protein LOC119677687 n=1 Tax=Teleopsis dalmanni TaxID=139649 RepID=UPI0018CD8C05|nr:uncharacterized protein LOC119677687 [Teleopsis dalmanni]XP_037950365.1 uncharacterized protein LOC119681289 [Teleopsis dalmanni]XP_037952840.1 uncharacterized protein LOC119683270 [Teleopsis dalmanni]